MPRSPTPIVCTGSVLWPITLYKFGINWCYKFRTSLVCGTNPVLSHVLCLKLYCGSDPSNTNLLILAYSNKIKSNAWNEYIGYSLQWRNNDRYGVSNHQPHDCLLNRLFMRRSKNPNKQINNLPPPPPPPPKAPLHWPFCGEFTGERWILCT